MPPALAKAPIFQPPKCLVKSRPSSQTPSSPSHSHRMTQNRLKLTKPYTSVPLPLGQSVIFPWWTIVWRKQLLAIEWHMWDEKSLVKTWHLATTHQPNQDVSNHVQREKTLLILMVLPGVRWRGGFIKLWYLFREISNEQNVSKWTVAVPRNPGPASLQEISCAVTYNAAKGKVTCLTPAFSQLWKKMQFASTASVFGR